MLSSNVLKNDFVALYFLSNEMIFDVNLFSTFMMYRILTESYASLIIFIDNRRIVLIVS